MTILDGIEQEKDDDFSMLSQYPYAQCNFLNKLSTSSARRKFTFSLLFATVFPNSILAQKMSTKTYFSDPIAKLLDQALAGASISRSDLASSKANINEKGMFGTTPIIFAVIMLNAGAVNTLLGIGADPNIRQLNGHNAITAAYDVIHADKGVFELLVRSGKCDLNVKMPDDELMIFYIAASGRLELLKLLLQAGANPSLKTRTGRHLVIAAAYQEEYDAIQLFLDAGASPHVADSAGESLLQLVRDGSSQHVDPNGKVDQSRLRLLSRLSKM